MGRLINFPERNTIRIWLVMLRESKNFHAYNSVTVRKELTRSINFVRPRGVK